MMDLNTNQHNCTRRITFCHSFRPFKKKRSRCQEKSRKGSALFSMLFFVIAISVRKCVTARTNYQINKRDAQYHFATLWIKPIYCNDLRFVERRIFDNMLLFFFWYQRQFCVRFDIWLCFFYCQNISMDFVRMGMWKHGTWPNGYGRLYVYILTTSANGLALSERKHLLYV